MSQSNEIILKNLNLLATEYKKDTTLKFKYNALQKAIYYISQYPHPIISGSYAKKDISNIGEGIAKRIDEILNTGSLQELTQYQTNINPELIAINELKRITGIGDTRAKSLVKEGITNIEEYKRAIGEKKVKTTHHIDLGLRYYDDF